MAHLSQIEIEAIVMATAPRDERVRQHLRECPDCAERLAREANLEAALHESMLVPAAMGGRDSVSRGWRVTWSAAAALAVVAAGAWFAASRDHGIAGTTGKSRPSESAVPSSSSDTPGLLDPREFAPGYSLIPPADYCRRPSALVESGVPR